MRTAAPSMRSRILQKVAAPLKSSHGSFKGLQLMPLDSREEGGTPGQRLDSSSKHSGWQYPLTAARKDGGTPEQRQDSSKYPNQNCNRCWTEAARIRRLHAWDRHTKMC